MNVLTEDVQHCSVLLGPLFCYDVVVIHDIEKEINSI